jgi:hypothetical protein
MILILNDFISKNRTCGVRVTATLLSHSKKVGEWQYFMTDRTRKTLHYETSIRQILWSLQIILGSLRCLNRALWHTYVIWTNKMRTFLHCCFYLIVVSSTCFEHPSVHPQEDLYSTCSFMVFISSIHISSLVESRMCLIISSRKW